MMIILWIVILLKVARCENARLNNILNSTTTQPSAFALSATLKLLGPSLLLSLPHLPSTTARSTANHTRLKPDAIPDLTQVAPSASEDQLLSVSQSPSYRPTFLSHFTPSRTDSPTLQPSTSPPSHLRREA